MSATLTPPITGARAEFVVVRGAMLALALVAVPTLIIAGGLQGVPGLVGAAAGLGLAAVLFGVSGLCYVWSGRCAGRDAVRVMVAGLSARIVGYLAGFAALTGVDSLHRPSLAAAAAAGLAVGLTCELRLLHRTPQLYWVRTDDRIARTRS